ncbi:MAG TPA: PfkB family carbohydrate kinase [Thermoanaerobaculia bacterium]|nr:PfkB family carbohydrate kinase [Thermoanaerobaculia bacterium]
MSPAPATPTTDRLVELVGAMQGRRVAILADLVVDRFVSGVAKRISREAPVLILRYEGERIAPGGGANAVANIAALGGVPLALGVVGDDPSGRELLSELEARGVATGGVRVRPGYRTPTKTRILGGAKGTIKQQIVRLDVEEHLALDAADRAHFRAALAAAGADGSPPVAVLSDYGYGAVEPAFVPELRRALPEALLLCDSRFRLAAFQGVDGATPNEEEAEALHGGALDEPSAGVHLLARLGLAFLAVTRGSRGLSLFLPGGSAHMPVHGSAQVADVTGAGDTAIGTFALALAAGGSPLEAAALANYAGGIVVMKTGTATASPEELEAAVRSDPRPLEELRWVES